MSVDVIKIGITERDITGALKQEIHSIQVFADCLPQVFYFWPSFMYLA